MVIRGICCLHSGIPGQTDNIKIISIVGRFLEHSRIYIFGKGVWEEMYISSADFMTRNTVRRVEVSAPINDPAIKDRIRDMFKLLLSDNVKARIQCPSGEYKYVKHTEPLVNAQEVQYEMAYSQINGNEKK